MGGINYHTSGHPQCSRFPDTTSKLSQIAPKFPQKLDLLQLGCGLSGVLLVQYPDPHPFSRLFCGPSFRASKKTEHSTTAGSPVVPGYHCRTPHTHAHTRYSTDAPAPHARIRLFCVPSRRFATGFLEFWCVRKTRGLNSTLSVFSRSQEFLVLSLSLSSHFFCCLRVRLRL